MRRTLIVITLISIQLNCHAGEADEIRPPRRRSIIEALGGKTKGSSAQLGGEMEAEQTGRRPATHAGEQGPLAHLRSRLEEGRALERGEISKAVSELQAALTKLRYMLRRTHSFDQLTQAALRWFQRVNSLNPSGALNRPTLSTLEARLRNASELPKPKAPAADRDVSKTGLPLPLLRSRTASAPNDRAVSASAPAAAAPNPPIAPAPRLDPTPASDLPPSGSSALGARLAARAERIARARNTVGKCYSAVADAVDLEVARFLTGMSAWMAADQLARRAEFREVRVVGADLLRLPKGAIVVWRKTGASPHGHISVYLGNEREASDHVAPQRLSLRGDSTPRVFVPR